MAQNLTPGQLVILTSMEDVSKRGKYQLGRVHEVIPQNRNGKEIVRRVKVATTSTDESTGDVKVVYVLTLISTVILGNLIGTYVDKCQHAFFVCISMLL